MNERVYLVEWLGVRAYIRAATRAKAKWKAMRSAREAGSWRPGQSLEGLRARIAPFVPSDVAVMDGTTT